MQNSLKTRVLITNDDGIDSANLRTLAQALGQIADVYVFAPETEQSGVGQAFTVRRKLSLRNVEGQFFALSGTPADCVKFALGHFAHHGLTGGQGSGNFDVCFSGVNIGENSGVSSLYSGTVAGAREAALWGVPGIALSLRGTGGEHLKTAVDFACSVVKKGLFKQIPSGSFWNVNFPKASAQNFKGFKVATMALGMFTDHYTHQEGLWQLDGEKLWENALEGSDDCLLNQGFATITPHHIDQTDVKSLNKINEMLAEGTFLPAAGNERG